MRARPHSSPLSFSNSTYLKLFVLLILLIAVVLVSAAVFVYYPASINASWVNPPVTFFNPGTSGVSVTLYDDNTRADIEVTSPGVLVRTQRNAFFYDDFSTNPFPSRLTTNGGTWNWDPAGYITVSSSTNPTTWGGACVAYPSASPPSGTNVVYVLVKERHATSANGQYSGLITAESSSEFFLMGYNRGAGNTRRVRIRRYVWPAWSTPATQNQELSDNTWFIFFGRRFYPAAGGTVSFTVYTSGGDEIRTITATDNTYVSSVNIVGVGVYRTGGTITASFDDLVACANADPRFVTVTGLTQGWTVILRNSTGHSVDQRTADQSGSVNLNVLTQPIIREASFEIRYGNIVILPSQSFSEVVGGDVYECRIRDMNILGFQNHDSKAYNVYVRVESLQVPNGYSGSINLWLGSGTATTPIQIVGNTINQDTTSTITLGPGATNYLHGTFSLSPSPSTPVELTLSFHYYLQGVEVEYPVKVTIHRGSGTLGLDQSLNTSNLDKNVFIWPEETPEEVIIDIEEEETD
ncbi:MAG: hypothetical protein QXR97_06910 [Thermoproteota archaeon]